MWGGEEFGEEVEHRKKKVYESKKYFGSLCTYISVNAKKKIMFWVFDVLP